METDKWPLCYWSSIVYSADVIDSHRAPRAGQNSAERSDAPPSPQSDQPVSASTPSDSRGVIILVPVRLGGEKTNPDYFNFAKVRDTRRSEFVELCFGQITLSFGVWSHVYTHTHRGKVSKSNYTVNMLLWGVDEFKISVLLSGCGKENESIQMFFVFLCPILCI